MRIAIVHGEYNRRSGFPRYTAQLATGLHALGHHVVVYTREGRADAAPEDAGIEFRTYRTFRRPLLWHMATEPWFVTRLCREIASDFDAILSVGIPCLAPVVLIGPGTHRAWYLTTTRSLPLWSLRRWVETVRPFHKIVCAWERAMLRGLHPTLVVVPGDRGAAEYTELFGFPTDRLARVPLSVEVDEFRFDPVLRARTRAELGIPEGAKVLVNVARRGRQKGLDVLAEALSRLPDDLDFRMLFIGDGSTSHMLETATAHLRAAGKVRLLGRVPDVRALYCAADLVVFPSRFDPWGLVVTESLATGTPVLCSSRIGAAMAVRDGSNGRLIRNPEDPDEIRAGIEDLLSRTFDRDEVASSVRDFDHVAVTHQLAEAILTPGSAPERLRSAR